MSRDFFEIKPQMETKRAALSAEEGVNVYYPEKINITGHFDQSG
jgi:hypothetical protein